MTQSSHPAPVAIPIELARAILAYLGRHPYAQVKVIADDLGGAVVAWEGAEQQMRISELLSQARTGDASASGAEPTRSTAAIEAEVRTGSPKPHQNEARAYVP